MQMALEALEQYKGVVVTHHDPESFRRMEVDGGQAARDAIAVLRAALAEPEQEPVAYCTLEQLAALKLTVPSSDKIALYTAPTPRKPLSDEQIALIVGECAASAYQHDDFSFARAIERAHGIGEQT